MKKFDNIEFLKESLFGNINEKLEVPKISNKIDCCFWVWSYMVEGMRGRGCGAGEGG